MAFLLKAGANINVKDIEGRMPIHYVMFYSRYSALKERVDLINLLLEYNVDVNSQSDFGFTPLHFIANSLVGKKMYCQDLEVGLIEFLFSLGANDELKDSV